MRRDNRHAHSTTKYLNGHFDVVGGIAIVADDHELSDRLKFLQNAVGAAAALCGCRSAPGWQ
jgi:cystathionine beta-lyase/cystathionine gamma-synthase